LLKTRLVVFILLILLCGIGCNSLTSIEEQQYQNLISQGAIPHDPKSPALGALLNILPGIGDIVNGEWGAFALDFLLWPISVIWAIPQGAITASNINKHETIAYYKIGPGKGKYDPNYCPDSE